MGKLAIVRKRVLQPGELELSPQLEAIITPELRRQHNAEKAYASALNDAQLAQQKFQAAGVELQKRNDRAAAKIEVALQLLDLPSDTPFDAHYVEEEDRVVVIVKQEDGGPLTAGAAAIAELKERTKPAEAEGQQPTGEAIKEGEDGPGS